MTDTQGKPTPCSHEWTEWKVVGYTGDWFHPHIVERECKKCGQGDSDER